MVGIGGYYNLPGLKTTPPTPPKFPDSGTDQSGNPLRLGDVQRHGVGFMRITVTESSIAGTFVTVDPASGKTGVGDSFTVDLGKGTVSTGAVKKAAPVKKGVPVKKAAKKGGAGDRANRV